MQCETTSIEEISLFDLDLSNEIWSIPIFIDGLSEKPANTNETIDTDQTPDELLKPNEEKSHFQEKSTTTQKDFQNIVEIGDDTPGKEQQEMVSSTLFVFF